MELNGARCRIMVGRSYIGGGAMVNIGVKVLITKRII